MPARGQARESAGRQRSANGELAVRLKQKVLSDRDLPWGGYGQGELAQAGAHRVYQDPAKLTRHIDDLGVRFRVQERLEITDSECRPQCAQTVLDTADIVREGDVTTATVPSFSSRARTAPMMASALDRILPGGAGRSWRRNP